MLQVLFGLDMKYINLRLNTHQIKVGQIGINIQRQDLTEILKMDDMEKNELTNKEIKKNTYLRRIPTNVLKTKRRNMLTEKYMQEVSNIINCYLDQNRLFDAKKILQDELKTYPNEYWLLTTLSNVFYELKDYNSALEFSERALSIESSDYLVINNHACILSVMEGKEEEAIELFKKIIFTELDKIAFGKYGEGIRWAKSLVNDCRVRLALVYLSINEKLRAMKYLDDHLANRERGVFSNFTKKEILKKKQSILSEV